MKRIQCNLFLLLTLVTLFSSCEPGFNAAPKDPSPDAKSDASTKIVLPAVTLTPCGYGFTVHASAGGQPYTLAMQYVIKTMGNVQVDSGTVFNGNNTNWVLTACTQYKITITSFWWTQNLIQTSDGCGNIFMC